MNIHIVVGGPENLLPSLSEYDKANVIWVGVDKGVIYLLEREINPKRAFGDFDSVTERELQLIQEKVPHLNVYPAQKDETDIELALAWAMEQKPKKINIFGATGGRLDHLLANVQLLIRGIDTESELSIIDKKNIVTVQREGEYHVNINKQYPYISFLPFTKEVKGIHLKGFKYGLTDENITWGSTLCISNELVSEKGTYSFQEGIIIMVRSTD